MQKQKTANRKRPRASVKDHSKGSSAYLALFGCLVILVGGFFFAGRHHFASMDFGIKNSRLRKQIEDLKAEKQRLLFTRELSVSPSEIKRSAERAGILGGRTQDPLTPRLASVKRDNRKAPARPDDGPTVIKTASIQPTAQPPQKAIELVDRTEKRVRSVVTE